MNDRREAEPGLDGALRHAFGKRSAETGGATTPASPDAPADLLVPGRTVGPFRVLRSIGQGGMGELFLAHDERLDRRVALKSIRARARLSTEARRRFHREARMLGKLDHPGICRIYDYVEADGCDFLVLELIDGEPLSTVLKRPLSHATALGYARQITGALASAHAQGVIHRDLKPTNLMVTPEGAVKVLDFGIARALADSGLQRGADTTTEADAAAPPGLTQIGAVMGTLDYMSPEQARGEPVTGATDMYALGLLLQEMWTGVKARPRGLEPLDLLQHIEAEGRLPADGIRSDVRHFIDELCSPLPTVRPTAHAATSRLQFILGRRRRHVRALVAAAAFLVIALGSLKYTLDLQTAHAASIDNQNRADRLLRFMATELWTEVDRLGQLEILEDVGAKLSEYFESIPADELSDERLADYSRALRQIGTVWRDKRDDESDRASRAYHSSWRLAKALSERDPSNLDRRFDVGQAQFYVGELAFLRGDYPTAQTWFERYHAVSVALGEADPLNEDYAMELAWSEHNLGALYVAQGKPEAARGIFGQSVVAWRGFLERHPNDPDWMEELASSLSWLARSNLAAGHILKAREALIESLSTWRSLHEMDPDRRGWLHAWAVAGQQLASIHTLTGDAAAARALLDETHVALTTLCSWDEANSEWARTMAINELHRGRALMDLDRMAEAGAHLQRCASDLEQLREASVEDDDQSYQCAAAHVSLAEWAWLNDDRPLAEHHAAIAHGLIQPNGQTALPAAAQSPLKAAWVARSAIMGAVYTRGAERQDCLTRAEASLAPFAGSCHDPRFLFPLRFLAICQGDEARARDLSNELQAADATSPTWDRLAEGAVREFAAAPTDAR